MNTHESYVSLETAKMLKEAGFDWKIASYYVRYYEGDGNDDSIPTEEFRLHIGDNTYCTDYNNTPLTYINGILHKLSAPTLDVAQRWLREVKNCSIMIDVFVHDLDKNNIYYTYNWIMYLDGERYSGSNWDDTRYYEVAQEAGIKKALELILLKEK